MNHCLPIKWLPDALPGQVEAALRDVLGHWSRDWGAPLAKTISARALPAHAGPAVDRLAPWAEMPDDWLIALARALLGPASTTSAVARGAVRQAANELQHTLRQRFQQHRARAFSPARVGHGGVEVSFELLDRPFGFVLDLNELQAGGWLPTPLIKSLQAIALEPALRDVPVPLCATLGHASASVTDVLQLRPGDILLLAETIEAPLQVVSPGSSLQLSAHLGASAAATSPARRAMRWLAT